MLTWNLGAISGRPRHRNTGNRVDRLDVVQRIHQGNLAARDGRLLPLTLPPVLSGHVTKVRRFRVRSKRCDHLHDLSMLVPMQ